MKMLRYIPFLLTAATCPLAQDHIRVGSWNLEHFGARTNPRKASDFAGIAKYIEKIGVTRSTCSTA